MQTWTKQTSRGECTVTVNDDGIVAAVEILGIGRVEYTGGVSLGPAPIPPTVANGIEYRFAVGHGSVRVGLTNDEHAALKALCDAGREAAHQRLLAAVPGLDELRAAYNEHEAYSHEFSHRLDREDYQPVPLPQTDLDELCAKYPRAALYLEAEGYARASRVGKNMAGKKALSLIASGGDLDEARAILKNWLPPERMWD